MFIYILATDADGDFVMEPIHEVDLSASNHGGNKLRYFIYQRNRYIWLHDHGMFINVQALNERMTINLLMESHTGINKWQQNEL